MFKYPFVVLRINSRQYLKVIALGNHLLVSLTGNGLYMTPIPSLVVLQAAVTACEDAYAQWGQVGSRGSRASLLDLRQKSQVLFELIKAIAEYVQNTAIITAGSDYGAMASILGTSGFDLNSAKVPHGLLEPVQNFHRAMDRSLNQNVGKMKFKRPLNTSATKDVSIYEVRRSNTPVFADARNIMQITRTEFTDTNQTGATVTWYYWVVPYNAAGQGAASEMLAVTLLPA